MKIFICGQKSFGKAVLKALYEAGHEITGIAPPPQKKYKDKMVGYATLKNIPIISDCDSLISDYIPDGTELIISAHSHWMISGKCLEKCKYGGIGFHPSLLPRHRGQDAVRWAVHMGDAVTGMTIYSLKGNVCDGGDILMQELQFIGNGWDYHRLWNEMFPKAVKMVVKAVSTIQSGKAEWTRQDNEFATWEPSWDRPRLKRNELFALGSFNGCAACNFSTGCENCTMHIADSEAYPGRPCISVNGKV